MEIDILGGSYRNRYIAFNSQRTINWYMNVDMSEIEQSKQKKALFPTPGLAVFADSTLTYGRGGINAKTVSYNRAFAVFDNVLYEVSTDGTLTSRGTMTDMSIDSTEVYLKVNAGQQIMIAHSSASYTFNLSTNVLAKITDGDFPGSIDSLDYTAGYGLVTSNGRVYYSDLNDFTSWNASSVFTPAASADNTLAICVWRDDVYCFGSYTVETYVNDGTSPFSKQGRDTIDVGLVAVSTLKKFKDGMLFLGKSEEGQMNVYFHNGQTCESVTPFSVAWFLNNPLQLSGSTWDQLTTYTWDQWFEAWGSSIASATADLEYTRDGHILYLLTIPLLNTTYCLDFTTKIWTERQSYNPAALSEGEFRGRYFFNFDSLNLWFDKYTGKLLKEDYTIVTEDSSPITRTRICQIFSEEDKLISVYDLILDVNTGMGLVASPSTNANIALYISKDAGNTYGSAKTLKLGSSSSYITRTRQTNLGTARKWALKLVVTDAADVMIQGAVAHGVIGKY